MSAKPRIEASRIRHEANMLAMLPPDAGVRKCGANHWRSRCPLHGSKGMTFGVWYGAQGWTFTCFACGEKGSVIDFAMKTQRLSFQQALDKLSGGAMEPLPVALWATPVSKKAFVIPCVGKGCSNRIEVDAADLPWLGRGLANHWDFRRHDGTVSGRCYWCSRSADFDARLRTWCQRQVGAGGDAGRMQTSGTEGSGAIPPSMPVGTRATGLAESPNTPRRPVV